jgi:hypothetical protein
LKGKNAKGEQDTIHERNSMDQNYRTYEELNVYILICAMGKIFIMFIYLKTYKYVGCLLIKSKLNS